MAEGGAMAGGPPTAALEDGSLETANSQALSGSARSKSFLSGPSQVFESVFEPSEEEVIQALGRKSTTKLHCTAFQAKFNTWDPMRQKVWLLLDHRYFDNIMGLIIIFNIILMLLEADGRARCYPKQCVNTTIVNTNRTLLGIYTVEAGVRAFADRQDYFKSGWNILDFCIVCLGWFDELLTLITAGKAGGALQVLPMLRVLRVARLLRAVKWIKYYPELFFMIRGFLGAMKAMFFGLMLILVLLTFWSLLTVEVINPINKEMMKDPEKYDEFCDQAFSGIFEAAVLYFQTLVAGDSWGRCFIPLIMESWFIAGPLFAMALVSVSLGFMNLILAVIVDNATSTRLADKEDQMRAKQNEQKEQLKRWGEVIKKIDEDESGSISMEELMAAYDDPEVRQVLEIMGVDLRDLECIFTLLDKDNSGDLDYTEFIQAFLKAQGQDIRIYMMMQKIQVDAMAAELGRLTTTLDSLSSAAPGSVSGLRHTATRPEELKQTTQPQLSKGALPSSRGDWKAESTKAAFSAARTLPAVPEAAGSLGSLSLEGDFRDINRRLEEQLAALAKSLQRNTATLARHTKVLEETALCPPKPEAKEEPRRGSASRPRPVPLATAGSAPPAQDGPPPPDKYAADFEACTV